MSGLRGAALLLALLAWSGGGVADQYRSEARSGNAAPAGATTDVPAAGQDHYARALILRDQALQALARGDRAAASEKLKQALAQHGLSAPADEEIRQTLATLNAGAGSNPDAVIAALEPSLRQNGALMPEQLAALGSAYAEKKRFDAALGPLQRAIAATRPPPQAWLRNLVVAEIGSGHAKQALPLLQQLIQSIPADAALWQQWIGALASSKDWDGAWATLLVAQRLGYLTGPQWRLQLVALAGQQGAPYQAASWLQRSLEQRELPASRERWLWLAQLWSKARERARAIDALQRAQSLHGDATQALQLGALFMQSQRYADAARAYTQARALGANGSELDLALAFARYQSADVDGALAAFRAASAQPPSHALAMQWIGYLQSATAREQALRSYAQVEVPAATSTALAPALAAQSVAAASSASIASVNPPDAAAAPASLTAVGAEQAGSADGAIPAYTGGLTRAQWPRDFAPGRRLQNPFAGEQPLYVVTRQTQAHYQGQLSEGSRTLFARDADYAMRVFPAHRTVAFPAAILQATQANIGRAQLIGADAIRGAQQGFPFPHPSDGVQALWNHRLRYRGDSLKLIAHQAVVSPSGAGTRYEQTEILYARYANLHDPADLAQDNVLLYYLTLFAHVGGTLDFLALVHESANATNHPRAVWVMPQGLHRMFRIPPVGYDQPFPGSDGLYFIDMVDMYNGPFDHYVWKLLGKHELLIPYNDFGLVDGRHADAELLTARHFNTALTRYELHRVWVVEATTRPGSHHSFDRRVFYLDEDSWNVVLVENYGSDGRLWRFQEGHLVPLYDVQAANCLPVVTYDFHDGRYFANHLMGETPPIQYDLPAIRGSDFTPASVLAHYAP